MGKDYYIEMEHLDATYVKARDENVENITQFLQDNMNKTLYSAGSGGSLALAEYVGLVTGATPDTPYGLMQRGLGARKTAVIMASAGGNNHDIMQIGRYCKENYINAFGLIAESSSKLSKIIDCYEVNMERDGFLATNSLLAGMVWIAKAMGIKLPDKLNGCRDLNLNLPNNELILLYDRFSKPAAIDFETRCIEAGLCNVIMSDYRNFGHGRYTWLNKYPDTEVIAFTNPTCIKMAHATENLIDRKLIRVNTNHIEAGGCLELVKASMIITGEIGKRKGINPGMIKNQTCKELYKLNPEGLI